MNKDLNALEGYHAIKLKADLKQAVEPVAHAFNKSLESKGPIANFLGVKAVHRHLLEENETIKEMLEEGRTPFIQGVFLYKIDGLKLKKVFDCPLGGIDRADLESTHHWIYKSQDQCQSHQPHRLQSITKSIVAMAMIRVCEQDLKRKTQEARPLDTWLKETTLGDLYKQRKSLGQYCFLEGRLSSLNIPEAHQKISLYHLLTMQSGIDWNQEGPDSDANAFDDATKDYLDLVFEKEVKKRQFEYKDCDAILWGLCLELLCGKPCENVILDQLFTPLGIPASRVTWHKRAGKQSLPCSGGLILSPDDIAILAAALITNKDQKENSLFVNEKSLELLSTPAIDFVSLSNRKGMTKFNKGYGAGTWIDPHDQPHWSGIGGQKVYFLGKDHLLITIGAFYNESGEIAKSIYAQCGQIRRKVELLLCK